MSNPAKKYDNVTIILHWVIGIGILAIAGLELFRHEFPKGHFIREGLKSMHQPAGTAIFALILCRIMWRMTFAKVPAETNRGVASLATKFVHLALYGLMIGIPLVGMLYVFGSNKSIDFGWFALALPMKDTLGGIAKSMKEIHEAAGITILVLGLVHAAAALVHHYGLKDGLMSRMSFSRRLRRDNDDRGVFAAAE